MGTKLIAQNRKARRDYELLEKYECGLSLLGTEIKSLRTGSANLKESYVKCKNGELFLVGCHISPYSHASVDAHDPLRERKVLMHRREIEHCIKSVREKGLSLVPVSLYFRRGLCKVEVAIARGKKLYDKREDLKAKGADRALQRALSRRR